MDRRGAIRARIQFLRRRLTHTKRLMATLGRIILSGSQEAFKTQRLGELVWEKLYPSQPQPFISIAGALEDFGKGMSSSKESRFDQEPSLGTGIRREIYDSLKSTVVAEREVNVNADHEFAKSTQEGSKPGDYVVPITDSIKDSIRAWLFTSRSLSARRKGPRSLVPRVQSGKEGYVSKLKPLLLSTSYTQAALPRPFLGVTDAIRDQILFTVSGHFGGKAV